VNVVLAFPSAISLGLSSQWSVRALCMATGDRLLSLRGDKMTAATERFKAGDIIRYGSGVSALFRYDGTHNAGRLYGSHVLGGVHGASDLNFFDLQPASAEDIEFCRNTRPEWFAVELRVDARQAAAIKAKHRQRGLNAMAEHLCSTDYTDGFCSPDTNGLMSGAAHCRHHNLPRNGRDCVAKALGLVKAIESRGCSIVWDHDPALRDADSAGQTPAARSEHEGGGGDLTLQGAAVPTPKYVGIDVGTYIDEHTDDGR
jgi:hypothetical protein